MKKGTKTNAPQSCDVNFSKVKDRSVKVYLGTEKSEAVEIIGSRGKYAIHTDSSNEQLSKIRGKSGTLKEVKRAVASHLCGMHTEPTTPIKDVEKNSIEVIS